VSAGINRTAETLEKPEPEEEKMNIALFVRKTKDLLLNDEVLKEVEAATPGDKVFQKIQVVFSRITSAKAFYWKFSRIIN
jgi:hypothetical protein